MQNFIYNINSSDLSTGDIFDLFAREKGFKNISFVHLYFVPSLSDWEKENGSKKLNKNFRVYDLEDVRTAFEREGYKPEKRIRYLQYNLKKDYGSYEFFLGADFAISISSSEINDIITDFELRLDKDKYTNRFVSEMRIFSENPQISNSILEKIYSILEGLKPLEIPIEKEISQVYYLTIHRGDLRLTSVEIENNFIPESTPWVGNYDFLDSNNPEFILIHGKPGTGKTTFITSLLSKYKVVFITPEVLDALLDPNNLNWSISNLKNSVIVMEDSEYVLRDRNRFPDSHVGKILNLTDGILGKTLKTKIICTINSDLSEIDPALLRPGRCSALWEARELEPEEQILISKIISGTEPKNKPITLAELTNPMVTTKKDFKTGFKLVFS